MLRSSLRVAFGSLLLWMLFLPHVVLATGLPLQAQIAAEQMLIVHTEGMQEIITSVQLTDVGERSALIVPVPQPPEVEQFTAGTPLFTYLAAATQPTEEIIRRITAPGQESDSTIVQPAADPPPPRTLSTSDITVLDATTSPDLREWLARYDYAIPDDTQALLDAYAAEGWAFVVVRLEASPDGGIVPIRMRFASEEIVYPLRLHAAADSARDIDLYVLTDHRVAAAPLETRYAGRIADLEAPPDGLEALLAQAPYLTRLRLSDDSVDTTADLMIEQAPTDDPYRAVEVVYQNTAILQQYGLVGAMLCLIVLNVVTVTVAMGFKRRFDAINPDPSMRRSR